MNTAHKAGAEFAAEIADDAAAGDHSGIERQQAQPAGQFAVVVGEREQQTGDRANQRGVRLMPQQADNDGDADTDEKQHPTPKLPRIDDVVVHDEPVEDDPTQPSGSVAARSQPIQSEAVMPARSRTQRRTRNGNESELC